MARQFLIRSFAGLVVCLVLFSDLACGQDLEGYLVTGLQKYRQFDFEGALESFNTGLGLARKMNRRALLGTFCGNIGIVHRALGNYSEAISRFREALAVAREVGERQDEASLLGNLGAVYLDLGEYQNALSHLQEASEILESIGDLQGKGKAVGLIGNVYRELMNYPAAFSSYEKALRISREIGNRKEEATWLGNMGSLYGQSGNSMKALSYSELALEISRKIGDRVGEGAWLGTIGNIYGTLGDYQKALDGYEKALTISRDIGDRKSEATWLANLGLAHNYLGNYSEAISYYERALAVEKQIGLPTAQTEASLGDVYLEQGEKEKAYAIYKRLDMPLRLGRCYLQFQDYREARNEFLRILPALEKVGTPETLVADYIGLGLSYEGLKQYPQARDYFLKAVASIEREREGLPEGQRGQFFSGKLMGFSRLEPYEGLARVFRQLQDASEALYWAENTRARLLLETISRRSSEERLSLPASLSQKESDISVRFTALHKQLQVSRERNPELTKELDRELAILQKERDSFISQLRREHPEYAALQYPEPVRPKDFRLNPREVLLEYEVTETETLAWLIRGGEVVKSVAIPISRKNLTEQVKQYRGFFEGAEDYRELSRYDPNMGRRLHDLLLKDLTLDLKEGEPIIIVPDEILGILPFETLVVSLPSRLETITGKFGSYPVGVTYFGDLHPIIVYQSVTALSLVRGLNKAGARKEERLLVLADPVYDSQNMNGKPGNDGPGMRLRRVVTEDWQKAKNKGGAFPRLPGTLELAEKLKAVFAGRGVDVLKGAEASKQRLMQLPLRQYRYQVFATHGILDNEVPYIREPALVLSQEGIGSEYPAQDGFLRMTEVMGLNLDADLVALTACNTGIGKNQNGEGVMGMGRAFQYAGARAVLMSLWNVEDDSTNILTERFFAHLQEGKDRLEALILARSELRRAGYEHPFFWAPFILVGEK